MEPEFENKTLFNNGISRFILRLDFNHDVNVNFDNIINIISQDYDRFEKRLNRSITFNLKTGQTEFNKDEKFDHVMINESNNYSVTFSEFSKSIFFETSRYIDNKIYTNTMDKIITVLAKHYDNINSKRIGMRFINEFNETSKMGISRVFNKEIASYLKKATNKIALSRTIIIDEYNFDNYKMKVQYGLPNKYFPSVMTNYNLLIDIDAYTDAPQIIGDWRHTLGELNHLAYSKFIEFINPSLINTLR